MKEELEVANILVNLLHEKVIINPEKIFIIHGLFMYNPNTNTVTNININTNKDIFINDKISIQEKLKDIINSIIIDSNKNLNGLQIKEVSECIINNTKIILKVSTNILISVDFEIYYTIK